MLWDYAPDTGQAHYEARLNRAYRLSQYGKYVRIVKARHGLAAAKVIEDVLLEGCVSVDDLKREWESRAAEQEAQRAGSAMNGSTVSNGKLGGTLAKDYHRAADQQLHNGTQGDRTESGTRGFHETLRVLRQDLLLLPFHDSFRRPHVDNLRLAETVALRDPAFARGLKGPELKATFKAKVESILEAWQLGNDPTVMEDDDFVPPAQPKKRKMQDPGLDGPLQKKPRINGTASMEQSSAGATGSAEAAQVRSGYWP